MRSALGSLAALAVCLGLLLCLAPGCSFLYHEEETIWHFGTIWDKRLLRPR